MTKKELLERLASYGDNEEVKIVDIKDENNFEEISVDEFLNDLDVKKELRAMESLLLSVANAALQEKLRIFKEDYTEVLEQMEDTEKILHNVKENEEVRNFRRGLKTVKDLLNVLDS